MTSLADIAASYGKFMPISTNMCIITDVDYYIKNELPIRAYLLATFDYIDVNGLIITFKTEQDLFMFLLRWS